MLKNAKLAIEALSWEQFYPERQTCTDCHCDRNSQFHDYIWASRCDPCANQFDSANREKRRQLDANAKCFKCNTKTGYDGHELCVECCEHSDCDDHCCLICGTDMREHWAAEAEWQADSFYDR